MKKIIVLIMVASLTIAAALVPTAAHAACSQTIYAEWSFTNGVTTQILGRTSSLTTIMFFGNTTDPEVARMITAAVSQRNRINVLGNATSCPTSGTFRFVGTILSATQQP